MKPLHSLAVALQRLVRRTAVPNQNQGAGVVKRFRVNGVCLVPTYCTMIVDAVSEEDAVRIALASEWTDYVDQNGGDDGAAFDWNPSAEEIQSPNARSERPPGGGQ